MKMTPEEIDVFKNLSESELGVFLVAYMKRVQDYAYDSRNWDKDMTPAAAKLAANLLQQHFIEKIRPQHNSPTILNQHE